MSQLSLFDALDTDTFAEERTLACALPVHVHLGTSSWTFLGWKGLCYPTDISEADLLSRGLELYTRYPLFRTVGIDRSYYRPLRDDQLHHYARQLPSGFPCVVKVWAAIVTRNDPNTGARSEAFLNVPLFERNVLAPLTRAFKQHVACIVFEMPRDASGTTADQLAGELGTFFSRVARELPMAVELRTRAHFAAPYIKTLRELRVGHVINWWEDMPSIREQVRLGGLVTSAENVVVRVMLPPGTRYEQRKRTLAPFNRLVDPQPAMRRDLVALAKLTAPLNMPLFVIVNNKAEGSSPLTVRALAELLAKPVEGDVREPSRL